MPDKPLTILFVPSDQWGCGLYRMFQPANVVARLNQDTDFMVHYEPSPEIFNEKDFDLLVLQRIRIKRNADESLLDLNLQLLEEARARGIPVIYEHDDNDFDLPRNHGMFHMFKQDRVAERVEVFLKEADAVTTTTPYLANVFCKHGATSEKTYVFPNCIDFTGRGWKFEYQPCKRFRIGWAGGSSHNDDLLQLTGVFSRVIEKHSNLQFQFMMGGYDTRGSYSFFDKDGKRISRPIEDHETIWLQMAQRYFDGIPDGVRRIMRTLPIENYGFFFSQFDAGVVPLEDTEFTRGKSPLKLIELGAYGVPVVMSDVEPYREMVKGTKVDPNLLVPVGKNVASHWVRMLSQLIDDDDYRYEQGVALQTLTKTRYDEERWAPLRLEFWRGMVGCKEQGLPPKPDPAGVIYGWDEV